MTSGNSHPTQGAGYNVKIFSKNRKRDQSGKMEESIRTKFESWKLARQLKSGKIARGKQNVQTPSKAP